MVVDNKKHTLPFIAYDPSAKGSESAGFSCSDINGTAPADLGTSFLFQESAKDSPPRRAGGSLPLLRPLVLFLPSPG